MSVRIYQPSRATPQSGMSKTRDWVVEHEPATPRQPEALMGWTSSGDTLNQIRMRFSSQEAAVAYAEREGLAYTVVPTAVRRVRPHSYVDRFRPGRPG